MTTRPIDPPPDSLGRNNWPGLDVVPSGPRAAVSRRASPAGLFHAAVSRLPVTVVASPDGPRALGRGGPAATHPPTRRVLRPDRPRRPDRLRRGLPDRGLGHRATSAGFLTVLAADATELIPAQPAEAAGDRRGPAARGMHRKAPRNTRGNIAHHYDLSNELFELFLDPTLSYSSALFDSVLVDRGHHLRRRRRSTPAAPGLRRPRAARSTGCSTRPRSAPAPASWRSAPAGASSRSAPPAAARACTRSRCPASRRRSPSARIAAAGCRRPRRGASCCDYRRRDGRYDAVLSVEMIEAVGHEYWPTYFETIDRLLAPGGRAAIQAITMPHDRMLATRRTYTWINKYIFPGGFLPSVEAIEQITRTRTSLRVDRAGCRSGAHYAETLRQLGRGVPRRRDGSATSASTRRSCGCGTSTWSTPGPASPPATSTSTS